ncbi:B12-binding domain-containing radical SAM protein [candidate division CSSED10-310 bacterium]|uniref:B12-binding domain-containing radical SAM protein n=1 Tax=candidate division CSSED10-310 bacterium TaxID=2855610 RepID=A0ABV6Z440_UNCC1
MSYRVILVEPRGVQANVFTRYLTLPLLGPISMGSELNEMGMEVRIFNENVVGRDISLSELEGDVLCLSTLTPTAERAYEIARHFKARNRQSRVIIGGIHASSVPEEASQFADHVVVGEGEQIIGDLIKYGSNEKVIKTERIADLEQLPLPDFSLLHQYQRVRITPVMTSRGCPFGCTFCTVTQMFGRRYRTISVDRVMAEVERSWNRNIFFYDDNFVVNKVRTDQLLERLISSRRKYKWFAQVRTDVTRDPDFVEKMARAGCKWVYVGFESINEDTLNAMQKNQSCEDIERSIRIFHRFGISIHGMFILGNDQDQRNVFQTTLKFCKKMKIESVQFMILTPFPGTETYSQLEAEGRLIHHLWQYYDGMHAVFEPKWMTAAELQVGMLRAFEDFYSLTRLLLDSFNTGIFLIIGGLNKISNLFHWRLSRRKFHFLIYLFARRIVSKFKHFNREYIQFLSDLKIQCIQNKNVSKWLWKESP